MHALNQEQLLFSGIGRFHVTVQNTVCFSWISSIRFIRISFESGPATVLQTSSIDEDCHWLSLVSYFFHMLMACSSLFDMLDV